MDVTSSTSVTKMARFLTHFSQYTFTLHHLRGKMDVVADALSRPPPEGLEDEEEKVPPLPDVTDTVHDCNEECAKNAAQVHEHRIRSAVLRNLSTEDTHLLLDDVDLRGESRPIGVAQQQVNTIDYHFVSPHLAPETKRAFQKGYEEDPSFKHQWLEGVQKGEVRQAQWSSVFQAEERRNSISPVCAECERASNKRHDQISCWKVISAS
ncbi:unnamed protein product [Phytophthora fragariaefolia]|uniref:Unnamed protein product n=1 Tax=Phytophthora fragariaefolia TaxID=1490495 RepID=A0A9W6X261_9STRA|nr:unnamed protein product [Phytophthora fragariaefolia]